LVSIAVAAITLAVFIHVLSADFVMWDDDIIIYENPNMQGLSLRQIGKIFTDIDSMMRYNPLTLLSWSITYHFWGLNPFWYHFGNWMLHGLNTVLVFFVLRKLLILASLNRNELKLDPQRINISTGLATLLWSIHPLRVEPVAWCTDRTYCQALFFLLLSLAFYLKANEPDTGKKRHYIFVSISIILYIVSLLSYAIGMTFFFVLFMLDIYLLKKPDGRWWQSTNGRRVLLEKIPFALSALVIAMITLCIRIDSAGVWRKPVSLADFGLLERFMQAMYICAYYIWRQWYPFNLAPVYSTLVSFKPFSSAFIASALSVVAIITLSILLRRRWPLGLAFIICYLLLLVPVLGVLEHPHYPCDRYSLIVSILWSILLAAWLAKPKLKILPHVISLALSISAVIILGLLTFRQTYIWTNSETLFKHTIKIFGNDPYRSKIYRRLGRLYRLRGNMEKAVENFLEAVEIDPCKFESQKDLAVTLQALGRFDQSIKILEKLVQIKPIEGHYLLAKTYLKNDEISQAVIHLKETLILAPDWVEPINCLAWILATDKDPKVRNPSEAIKLAKRGCELTNYKQADLLDALAAAYASAGKFSESVYFAEKALKLAELAPKPNQLERIQNNYRLYQQKQASIKQ
jgi:tetratricopeptide (TPR) repeat protein